MYLCVILYGVNDAEKYSKLGISTSHMLASVQLFVCLSAL